MTNNSVGSLLAAMLVASVAGAESPSLSGTRPFAITPGRTTEIAIVGEKVAGARALWTSLRADVFRIDGSNVVFGVRLSSDIPAGIGAIRVVTTNGITDPAFVVIDPLTGVAESSTNSSCSSAQLLRLPAAVDGVCEEMKSDFYKFRARKGHRLAIEVVAQRIGSLLDPRLRVLDARGRELAVVDDSPGAGADCAFVFPVPETGDYVIELRDTRYEGGAKHRYRLRVGEFDLTRLAFNADAMPGELREAGSQRLVRVREHEPNDSPHEAQKISVPGLLDGSFFKASDRDYYEFEAKENQTVRIGGRSRSLGFDSDLYLELQDQTGRKIAEANAAGLDEGTITNTFKKGGRYRVQVEELNLRGGADFNYQLELHSPPPQFALSANAVTVSGPPGGAIEIAVRPERRGYDGPITLHIVGLGEGFAVTNNVITGKTNEVKLKVSLPRESAPGDSLQFAIVGRAEVEGTPFEARASTRSALRKLFPKMRHPPDAMDGVIALGITAPPK